VELLLRLIDLEIDDRTLAAAFRCVLQEEHALGVWPETPTATSGLGSKQPLPDLNRGRPGSPAPISAISCTRRRHIMAKNILLIHGLWLTPRVWDNFTGYFQERAGSIEKWLEKETIK
jgi:hypothetical protein